MMSWRYNQRRIVPYLLVIEFPALLFLDRGSSGCRRYRFGRVVIAHRHPLVPRIVPMLHRLPSTTVPRAFLSMVRTHFALLSWFGGTEDSAVCGTVMSSYDKIGRIRKKERDQPRQWRNKRKPVGGSAKARRVRASDAGCCVLMHPASWHPGGYLPDKLFRSFVV